MTAASEAAPAVDAETLKIGGKAAGHLRIYHYNAPEGDVLLLAAFVLALAYGLVFFRRPPSPVKTVVKTGAVAALAGVSWFNGSPWLLTLGLALCAVGDAFLALDPKRWLPFGLGSFLAGHLAYVALFVSSILAHPDGPVVAPSLPHLAAMGVVLLVAGGMLAWLWRSLGGLRLPVMAYVAAIVAMVCSSLALPRLFGGADAGAILFFASDGVLSAQLFKQRFTGLLGQWVVWGCYFIGQVLIVMAFSPITG